MDRQWWNEFAQQEPKEYTMQDAQRIWEDNLERAGGQTTLLSFLQSLLGKEVLHTDSKPDKSK